jgi:hypothetical protein
VDLWLALLLSVDMLMPSYGYRQEIALTSLLSLVELYDI